MKINQFNCSILLKHCSDVKIFLSDVYKKGTPAKKHQACDLQYGRSMVEMLGVLAIIGVLSVGSIAGYSNAMLKYKLNKQAQQINTILNLMSRDRAIWKDNQSSMLEYYKKTNEIPKEMVQKNGTVKDIFGNAIEFSSNVGGCIRRSLVNVRLTKGTNWNICANIINVSKEQSSEIYFFSMSVNNKSVVSYSGEAYANGTNNLRTKTIADYEPYCKQCMENGCVMQFMWYLEKYC